MNETTSLIFVRHGEVHNPQNVFYGRQPDFWLSENGVHQASRTAKHLSKIVPSAIYSSPLERAQQTAEIIAKYHTEQEILSDEHIIEVKTPYDGKHIDVVKKRNWDVYTGSGPEFEQPNDILERVKRFISKVRKRHSGGNIFAVTHGEVILIASLWAKGFPVSDRPGKSSTELGFVEGFPATASETVFKFLENSEDQTPQFSYSTY